MYRMSALFISLSILAVGCAESSSPSAPSQGTRTTSTFTVPLSPANEVPPTTNADAGGSGTATIALIVTKDDGGNITSATADFQISVSGFPAGTVVTDAHIHNGGPGANASIYVNTGLASGELAMTVAYNGRIAAANQNDKKNFAIVWTNSIYTIDSWVIMKGSPNKFISNLFDEAFQRRYAASAASPEAWEAFRREWLDLPEAEYQAARARQAPA